MSPPSAKILKTDDCNNLKENPYIFQEQLWFNIFLRCDGDSLKKLFLVCKEFNRLLSWNGFWLEKCLQDRVNLPPKKWREFILKDTDKLFNYRIMWYKNPYNRNLAYKFTKADHLANLCESNRRMTFVVYNGGDGMLIEKEDDFLFRDDRVECCFATSYGWCTRFFELDLEECGLEPWIIDEIRPNITVKELCCCRNDCGAIYKTHSYLLLPEERFDRRTEKESRCRSVTKSWEQWEGGFEWEEAKMVFSDYCAGVRHFSMETSGKDTQFWAGHYGSKFANTEVIITFPDETRLLAPEEYKEPDTKPKPEIMPSRYNIPGFVRRLRNFRF